jgi:hypothetical protein
MFVEITTVGAKLYYDGGKKEFHVIRVGYICEMNIKFGQQASRGRPFGRHKLRWKNIKKRLIETGHKIVD